MNKYLFTDGSSGVKEAHSREELLALLKSTSDPVKTRIWQFSTNEWLSYPDFLKKNPAFNREENSKPVKDATDQPATRSGRKSWLKKTIFFAGSLTGALLIFNFTSAKWEKATPVKSFAARPANVPLMDIDSLVEEIEWLRGKGVDKGTRYNLRMRNNWPEYILLHLDAEKETKGKLSRFLNLRIGIDNTTGFELDHALVELRLWKEGKAETVDTVHFNGIRYDKMPVRELSGSYRGDSLSVSFLGIRAKAFNFCYSATVKNSSGNYNDRWFCRDGKPAY